MVNENRKRIVILGGGFGGIYTYQHLVRLTRHLKGVEIVMVNNTNHFLFTPLLHEVATGSIDPKHLGEPIRYIAPELDAFYECSVDRVSLAEKTVYTSHGQIPYDYLVVALGSQSFFFGTPGAKEYAFTLKTLKQARDLKNRCISLFERAAHISDHEELKSLLSFVVVGGGPTGVELAAELQEFLEESLARVYPVSLKQYLSITLVQRGEELVPQFPPLFRDTARRALEKKGIKLFFNRGVTEVKEDGVMLDNGEYIGAQTTVWTAGVAPVVPELDVEVAKDKRGRLIVDGGLQVKNQPGVYAIGDTAAYGDPALPALAQVAVDEAKMVAKAIVAHIEGKEHVLPAYEYRSKGTLMSLGRFKAVGEVGGYVFRGPLMWWLWRTIYLSKMYSWRKRLRVVVDWTFDLFTSRDITEI